MTICVLRVRGEETEVGFLLENIDLKVSSLWHKGQIDRKGGFLADSGFIADVVDAESISELMSELRKFLIFCSKNDISFSEKSLTSEISIGLFVGSSDQYVASVNFDAKDLQLISSLGLSLDISAYPTSDED